MGWKGEVKENILVDFALISEDQDSLDTIIQSDCSNVMHSRSCNHGCSYSYIKQ